MASTNALTGSFQDRKDNRELALLGNTKETALRKMAGAQKMLLHASVLLLIGALCIFSGFKTFAQADPVGAIRSSTVETPEGEDTAFHYVFETCKRTKRT